MDAAAPDYSIVLPAFNEEALLSCSVGRAPEALPGASRRNGWPRPAGPA